MKKPLLFIFAIAGCLNSYSQSDLRFNYDSAGNQIFRGEISSNITSKAADSTTVAEENTKSEITSEENLAEMEKVLIEISASPNPVTDVLQIIWKNTDDDYFVEMALFSYENRLLLHSNLGPNEQNSSLSFGRYPQGIYFLVFTTRKGEKQSYKIVKK